MLIRDKIQNIPTINTNVDIQSKKGHPSMLIGDKHQNIPTINTNVDIQSKKGHPFYAHRG